MFLYICLFLFCTPSAAYLDVPVFLYHKIVGMFVFDMLNISLLVFLVYLFLITYSEVTCNVRFIPYNVSLNMLVKRHRGRSNRKMLVISFSYKIFQLFLLYEDFASSMVFLEFVLLDNLCLCIILLVVELTVFLLKVGARSLHFIILQCEKILDPYFANYELAAFWIYSLLLILSSDLHPNPRPPLIGPKFLTWFFIVLQLESQYIK